MTTSQLVKRSFGYYWRTNIAVVLGVATAVAVLAGALLVGDSVRSSLRNLVVQRLGATSYLVSSTGFFREQLAADIQTTNQFSASGFASVCPLISLEGVVTHETSKRVASEIKVYGVDERFWTFHGRQGSAPQGRQLLVSQTLARELGAASGDSLILQVQRPTDIPLESLHSKKDQAGKVIRTTLGEALSADSLGEFSTEPQQAGVRAVFISLKQLQTELEQSNNVNLLLVSDRGSETEDKTTELNKILRERLTLEDGGIKLRKLSVGAQPVISLEHQSEMIDDALVGVSTETAKSLSMRAAPIFSYLANSISSGGRSIPYSLVTAVDDTDFKSFQRSNETQGSTLPPIILNDWAARDLEVKPGATITLEYYLWQEGGRLETKSSEFQLVGVTPIEGLAADRDLVPEYPGITGSENLADWDPPFPIDLDLVRQKDEDYWQQYRTTPKGFVPLQAGQTLWQSRFGKTTSLRLIPAGGNVDESLNAFATKLRSNLDPTLMGVFVVPVRAQGLEASKGATDFGEYFLYFSFFIVVSALLLTTLFFKLGIEQRIREIGILRAVGLSPGGIRKLFLVEGVLLAIVGSVIGIVGAIGYGRLMMFGLSTWWVDAVGTTSLKLAVSPVSIAIGVVGAVTAAVVCIALTLRSLNKQSTRSALSGNISDVAQPGIQKRFVSRLMIAHVFAATAVLLLILGAVKIIPEAAGFFGGGTLLLVAFLLYQSAWLRRSRRTNLSGKGLRPLIGLGLRNASYRPGRSVMCISLIASATFIIVTVDSFRHRESGENLDHKSGTGGYSLLADSLLPIVKDPSSSEGREELNLVIESPQSTLKDVTLTRFRVQPGDDTSCLNLYQPRNPKIIAPTSDFIAANRFDFASSIASTPEEQTNPWLLLNKQFSDGAIPVIADANSLAYVLHLKLGEDFLLPRGGEEVRLRVVAALTGSLFQSEFVMSEQNFVRLFPEQQGYRFFLVDTPNNIQPNAVAATLEDRLSDFGFDVQSTTERLASFHRVENTYLSTFQMLGGLGLVLGTIGLGAVLLRNVLERRRELALMRAVGYGKRDFIVMILAENALLLFSGVVTGTVCALLAILPVFITRHGGFANISLGLLLLAVLVSGLISSIAATWATLRSPLLTSLRAE